MLRTHIMLIFSFVTLYFVYVIWEVFLFYMLPYLDTLNDPYLCICEIYLMAIKLITLQIISKTQVLYI